MTRRFKVVTDSLYADFLRNGEVVEHLRWFDTAESYMVVRTSSGHRTLVSRTDVEPVIERSTGIFT